MSETNIYTAFLEMQKELPISIEKNQDVGFGKVKFKYATLDAIHKIVKPILHKHGFYLSYPIRDGFVCIELVDNTGAKLEAKIEFNPSTDSKVTGGLITYYKRYLITALLAIDTEDDIDAPGNAPMRKGKISDKAFKQAQDRIIAGKDEDKNLMTQVVNAFDLTQKQYDELLNLDLIHNHDG